MPWREVLRIATGNGVREYAFSGRGIPATLADANYRTCQLVEMSWMSLLSDSPFDPIKPASVFNRFYHRIENDLIGTIRAYSVLAQELLRSVTIEANAIKIAFVQGMKTTPVFREYLHFLQTHDVRCFRFVYSFLVFASKLDVDDPELEARAFRAWLAVERRLDRLTLDENIVSPLREIISGIMEYWDEADFLPVHGSGAVAEKGVHTIEEKCAFMSLPDKMAYLYSKVGYDAFPHQGPQRRLPVCVSKLLFVRKSYKSKRSICKEPAALQWGQQGVRMWTENAVSEWLKGFVNLKRQRINQSAAQFGSITQLVDTIDLSSASDSVAWDLVKRIFPVTILRHFYATRSTHVELPNGKYFELQKFSPMGSSLCFPVQTIIYSSVVVLAAVQTHIGSWNSDQVVDWLRKNDWKQLFKFNLTTRGQGKFQPFRCFGDDIITDKVLTSNVIDLLQLLGFKVNVEKSFVGDSAFRESCGGHYLCGHDVTPFYLRIPGFGKRMSKETLESAVEAANRALEFGYLRVRSVLINFVKHYPLEGIVDNFEVNPILFTDDPDTSLAIMSKKPRNTHLNFRCSGSGGTSTHLQRDEYESIGFRAKAESGVISFDNYHYTAWCRSRYHSQTEQMEHLKSVTSVAVKAGAVSTVWCWRWTPAL